MKRLIYFVLAMTLLVGLLVSACSQSETSSPVSTSAPGPTQAVSTTTAGTAQTSKPPTATPRYGGIFKQIHTLSVVNVGYVPDSAEPYDTWIAESALETLIKVMPDGSYGPRLATEYKVAPDYMSVTFTLRKGVKFHDGTDFNAQAVKYNIELYNKGKLDSLRYVSSVDVIDDYTVKVNFSKLQSGFLLPFATRPGQMTSPTALTNNPKEWFLTHTVGTGPFEFDNYVRDIKMDFKKFKGYWQQGKPYLDGIQWMTIADRTTALMSYKSGEAHTILYPAEKDRADLKKAGVNIVNIAGPIFTLLMDGGNASSPFSNLKVRQAVAHAVDKDGIAQGLGYGYWQPVNQFSYPEHFSYNKNVVGYNRDVAKAKQLLNEAGYPNGFKTTIYGAGTTGYNELVQAYLKEVGIEAEISLGTMANVAEWRQKGWTNGISITPAAGPQPYIDSRVGVAIFSSTSGSYPNIFHSPDIDDLIAQSDKEMEQNKKVQIYQQLQKMIIDTYCVAIPLYRNPGTIALSADVGYFNFQDATGASFEPAEAWLKK